MNRLFYGKKTLVMCWIVNYILGKNKYTPKPDKPIWEFRKRKKYRNNTISISYADCRGCIFDFRGNDNSITVGKNSILRNCELIIVGDGNKIELGTGCGVYNTSMTIEGEHQTIGIGDGLNAWGSESKIRIDAGNGSSIIIGNDCLLAPGCVIRSNDQHIIVDLDTKQQINQSQDIVLGEHVWLAAGATLLKGVRIGNGSIIAANSLVSKCQIGDNSLLIGSPARIAKDNVTWKM